MRTVKSLVVLLVCICVLLTSGCGSELKSCRLAKKAQLKQINELETYKRTADAKLAECGRQLDSAEEKCDLKSKALQQAIAAHEDDRAKLKGLIDRMQGQLLTGKPLPPELSVMLEEFATKNEMVTYDASRGIVKFKSDLLFKSGSDAVLPAAEQAVKSLCGILNSEQAKEFDIIIAGHTDDQPIRYSAAKHPTNWHLSAHRAISVLKIMGANNVNSMRLSARGFGEFRPVVPNEPNKKGHAQNRRVEIYIVAKGT
ncbi:MAG: OmpA/MotB family protein [Planctomycetota bacterium]|jgi:chemotaxis protein MotB